MHTENIYKYFLVFTFVRICFAGLLTGNLKYGLRVQETNSFCVHPIYPCYYYQPCYINYHNVNDLEILECAKGLVFDVTTQKCKWVNPWKSCLRLTIHKFIIKEGILRKFLSSGIINQGHRATTVASTTTRAASACTNVNCLNGGSCFEISLNKFGVCT
jgi:hypothetical protein